MASAGEGKRGTCPTRPAKMVGLSTFLKENSMFESFFRQIVCFCPPPWKILPSPGKSLRTPMGVPPNFYIQIIVPRILKC